MMQRASMRHGPARSISIFQWSLLLALGSAAAIALAAISLILSRPPPFYFPMSSFEVARLLNGEAIARSDPSLAITRSQDALAKSAAPGTFEEVIQSAVARRLGARPDAVNFNFVPGTDIFANPPIDAARAEYEGTIGPAAALYKDDPTFAPLIFGSFSASLRTPQGYWVNVSRVGPSAGPQWQVALTQLILLALAFIVPIAWFVSRRLSAPITAFAAAAERVGFGGFERVPVSGPREIETAARAINEMQDRIERYIKERTVIIGAIAHDLRTPLSRMSFLLAGKSQDQQARLEREIESMDKMIAGAMDFVRSETVEVTRDMFDLRQLVEGVLDDFADRGAKVELAPGPPVMMLGDTMLITRVITNLVANAVTYAGAAEAIVSTDGATAFVHVRDNGPGMAAEDLSRAFDPFFRAEVSRNRSTGGAGLGLAIVKSLTRAHGGGVALRNRVDGGLEAEISFPLRAESGRSIGGSPADEFSSPG